MPTLTAGSAQLFKVALALGIEPAWAGEFSSSEPAQSASEHTKVRFGRMAWESPSDDR